MCTAALSIAGPGCDHFRVESFHGSRITMTLSGLAPTAVGHHLELWVRSATEARPDVQSTVRVLASDGGQEADGNDCLTDDKWKKSDKVKSCGSLQPNHQCLPAAYAIVPALGPFHTEVGADGQTHAILDDPCIVDEKGNLMWSPDAIDPATGKPQGAEAAAALQKHIDDLVINGTANPSGPVLALVTRDDLSETQAPLVGAGASPEARLCACANYWNASAAAYTGNPRQLTAPLHGAFLGALDFSTTSPAQAFGGISYSSPWALVNAQELWFTDTESTIAKIDPEVYDCAASPTTCRGRVILDGTGSAIGRGSIHFELRSPTGGSAGGSAAIEVNLDSDTSQF